MPPCPLHLPASNSRHRPRALPARQLRDVLVGLLTSLALALGWCNLVVAATGTSVQVLTDAWMTPEAEPSQPPDWASAKRVTLPSDWADPGAARSAVRWYRLALSPRAVAGPPPALYGLYVERACSVLQVRLNGQLIHDGGRFEEPVSRNCHRPQLVAVPAALLLPEGNVLDLRVHGYALSQVSSRQRAGGLSPVEFGPYATMVGHHARRTVFAIRLPEVMSGALVLMGSFMFVMGWFNRKQSYLAYFGALMVGWSLLLARLWASELPMPNAVAEAATSRPSARRSRPGSSVCG